MALRLDINKQIINIVMQMSINNKMEAYYKKFIDLQEKLRQSEEERLTLEMKFNEMVQVSKEEEQAHYRKLRSQYKKFLEEDQKRQARNERVLLTLERIESRVNMLSSKTERFGMLRRQYQSYLQRITRIKPIVKREHYTPQILVSPPHEQSDVGQQSNESEFKNKSNTEQTLKETLGRSNDEKNDILDKYLQNISSRNSKETLENNPQSQSNQLKYFDDITKKFDEGFNSNQANSIAEDIMNSIYSRHYKKDIPQDDSKKANKFTATNYLDNHFDVKGYSEFGDSNKTSIQNDYTNVAVAEGFQIETAPKSNAGSKYMGDKSTASNVSNFSKCGENISKEYEDGTKKTFGIKEDEMRNGKIAFEKTLGSKVELLQKQPENSYLFSKSNEEDQRKNFAYTEDLVYPRSQRMNHDNMTYRPSKTEIDPNETEKSEFNENYCPVHTRQMKSEIKRNSYPNEEVQEEKYTAFEDQESHETVLNGEDGNDSVYDYEPGYCIENTLESEGHQKSYNISNHNTDPNYMTQRQNSILENPAVNQQINYSTSDEIFAGYEATKQNGEHVDDNYQVIQNENAQESNSTHQPYSYHEEQMYDDHDKLIPADYIDQQIMQIEHVQQFHDTQQSTGEGKSRQSSEQDFIENRVVISQQNNESAHLIEHYDEDIPKYQTDGKVTENVCNEDTTVNQQYAEDGQLTELVHTSNSIGRLVEQPYAGNNPIAEQFHESGHSKEQEYTDGMKGNLQPTEQEPSNTDNSQDQEESITSPKNVAIVAQQSDKLEQPLEEEITESDKIDQQHHEIEPIEVQYTKNVQVDEECNNSAQLTEQHLARSVDDNNDIQVNDSYIEEQQAVKQLYIESEPYNHLNPATSQSVQPDNESNENNQQYDASRQPTEHVEYSDVGYGDPQYDQNGQSVEQQCNDNNSANQQYNESDHVNHQLYNDNRDMQQYVGTGQTAYSYDQQYAGSGQLSQEQYDANGQDILEYDQNAQQIQYYENGKPIYQYDENGQLIQQYDETGQSVYQSNENDQLIQQYDENGDPISLYNTITERPMVQYDENSQQYDGAMQYDEHGKPIPQYSHPGPIYDQQFEGDPSNATLYDKNGVPISQYDENGQLLQEYDQNSKPLQSYEGNIEQQQVYNDGKYEADNRIEKENSQNEDAYFQGREDSGHDGLGNGQQNVDGLRDNNIEDGHLSKNNSENHRKNRNNVLDLLDTDTESIKQNVSRVSNDSDFDFSNG